jgi:hypothetical protein
MVDLTEAVERVAVFDQFPLEDDQPNIEAPSLSVLFDGYTDYNFGDRNAFETRWTEETQYIAQLVFIYLPQCRGYLNTSPARDINSRRYVHKYDLHI